MDPNLDVFMKPYGAYWITLNAYCEGAPQEKLPDPIREVIFALGEQFKTDAVKYAPPLLLARLWRSLPTHDQLGIDFFQALLCKVSKRTFLDKDRELIQQVLVIIQLASVALDLQGAALALPRELQMDAILERLKEVMLNPHFLRGCPNYPFNLELLTSCTEMVHALQMITHFVYAPPKKKSVYQPELKRKLNFCTDLLSLLGNQFGLGRCASNQLPGLLFSYFRTQAPVFSLPLSRRIGHYNEDLPQIVQKTLRPESGRKYCFLPDLEYSQLEYRIALSGVIFYFSDRDPIKLKIISEISPTFFVWSGKILDRPGQHYAHLIDVCQIIENEYAVQEFSEEHSPAA